MPTKVSTRARLTSVRAWVLLVVVEVAAAGLTIAGAGAVTVGALAVPVCGAAVARCLVHISYCSTPGCLLSTCVDALVGWLVGWLVPARGLGGGVRFVLWARGGWRGWPRAQCFLCLRPRGGVWCVGAFLVACACVGSFFLSAHPRPGWWGVWVCFLAIGFLAGWGCGGPGLLGGVVRPLVR